MLLHTYSDGYEISQYDDRIDLKIGDKVISKSLNFSDKPLRGMILSMSKMVYLFAGFGLVLDVDWTDKPGISFEKIEYDRNYAGIIKKGTAKLNKMKEYDEIGFVQGKRSLTLFIKSGAYGVSYKEKC